MSTSLILPKFVVLKGDNGKYLKRFYTGGVQYLQFSANDISDSLAMLELFPTTDGNFRIKNIDHGRFWRLGTNNWINPDSDDASGNDSVTLFLPMKIDDTTIALVNAAKDKICKRYTTGQATSFLSALADSVDDITAKLTVEEPVMARRIYGIRYDTDNANIYDETSLVLGRDSLSNNTDQPFSVTVSVIYDDTKIATWNDSFSLKSSKTATTEAAIPIIVDGKVVVSDEIQTEIQWGKTFTNKTPKKVETVVSVPPKTRAKVTLIATRTTCDVPFAYTQQDTLFSGSTLIYEYHGTFTGSNCYGIQFDVQFEPL